jgi:CubicO group peptidase (beta-lactamase class C family)
MTVRDLMRHTAGFGGYDGDVVAKQMNEAKPGGAKDLDDLATRLASVPLACHPGERFIYSRSIDLLGLVVQKTSGKDLDGFLHDRLLDPLGMVDTGFWVPDAKRDRFAVYYTGSDGSLEVVTGEGANERYYARPGLLSGGGGLVSTTSDYMRFLMMISNGGSWNGKRYLKPETVALMTHDQLPPEAFPIWSARGVKHGTGFGLGFSVRTADTEWDPDARIGEYAWDGAASTHYWVSPKDDNLIVVTMEQVRPFNFDTAWALKPVVYGALEK